MGYDKELPDDKIRLIENPKKYIEDFLETILPKKNNENELVSKGNENKEISTIIQKQIKSLKNSLESNNLTIDDVIKYIKNNE
jgi:hypothetical protein